ncbi:MAG: RNHCP domain-containing protein [Clostridia bacterium]|nr:RNHCP domain-containing protein [Clostridia bacterium]
METKRFTRNDSGFVCANCGKTVPPLRYSSRNHCPFCLWSLHVDVLPGDRANPCGGKMKPVAVRTDAKKGFVITHRCTLCGEEKNNRSQSDDDMSLLIPLTNVFNQL